MMGISQPRACFAQLLPIAVAYEAKLLLPLKPLYTMHMQARMTILSQGIFPRTVYDNTQHSCKSSNLLRTAAPGSPLSKRTSSPRVA
jgi:hypothetical protein